MYRHAYDKDRALYVAVWSGTVNTEEDFDAAIRDIVTIDRESAKQPAGTAVLIEVTPENPRLTSVERRRLIDAAKSASRAPKVHIALVTRSAITRGVLTAMQWFIPSSSGRFFSCHATSEQAILWIDARRPGVAPRLRELYRQTRESSLLATGSGSVAPPSWSRP